MPIKLTHTGKNTGFYQYGNQKKYYFKTERGMKIAYTKCLKQAQAIKISEKQKIINQELLVFVLFLPLSFLLSFLQVSILVFL